jgi:hypothetical protein
MLKPADKVILDAFYSISARGGSVVFDWIDPADTSETPVPYQVRFLDKLSYKYTGIGPTQRWDVAFSLEQA